MVPALGRLPTFNLGSASFGPTSAASSTSSNFSTRVSSRQPQRQHENSAMAPALLGRSHPSTQPSISRQQRAAVPQQRGNKQTKGIAVAAKRDGGVLTAGPSSNMLPGQQGDHNDVDPTTTTHVPTSQDTTQLPADANNASAAPAASSSHQSASQFACEGVPSELHTLLDPASPVSLPPPSSSSAAALDNSRLDRFVAALGRGRATWRRALLLYEWLKESDHALDDRLCTTLIRVCADHGDALSALSVYEWMRSPVKAGGAGLQPTAYTYTAAMRAVLSVGMLDRAMQVWEDSQKAGLVPDCRLCITYIEACTRLGLTDKALNMYYQMRDAPPGSPMKPSVHAYTAAMRAATEGGRWLRALGVWEDMRCSSCQPTGHAYAAAISACAAGQDWQRAVALFEDMITRSAIRPDVVSCTALVTALASAGEADKAEAVVAWMQKSGLKPNVRTYTALLTAMGNARQWSRAVRLLFTMQQPENGSVQPNAYTYSALIKALGEHGLWQLAEAVFEDLESQVRSARVASVAGDTPRAQTDAARVAVYQRLMAAAATAEATQQLPVPPSLPSLLNSTASLSSDLSSVAVAAAASAGPHQSGAGAASQQLEDMPFTSLGLLTTPPAATASSYSLDSSAFGTASDLMMHGSSSTGGQSTRASSPGLMPGTPPSPSTAATNWSHPSQLNGIQLNLLSAQDGRAPAASPSPAQHMDSLFPAGASTGLVSSKPGGREAAAEPASPAVEQPGKGLSLQQQLAANGVVSGAQPATATAADSFSLFSLQPFRASASEDGSSIRRSASEAAATINMQSSQQQPTSNSAATAAANAAGAHTPLVNEVVCGALMLAYERAGRWVEALSVLTRAKQLGLQPNTVMFNTAISAAGKAGQMQVVEQLFQAAPARDSVTYETMVAAYGMAGMPEKAEAMLKMMHGAGFRPRDYAYCGLIAAYSLVGNVDSALGVRRRMKRDGLQSPTVHVYNALLAACERAQRYEQALELLQTMKRENVEPNALTHQLMAVVGRHGVQTVETQQVAAAALSAVFAAAGGLLMRAGMF